MIVGLGMTSHMMVSMRATSRHKGGQARQSRDRLAEILNTRAETDCSHLHLPHPLPLHTRSTNMPSGIISKGSDDALTESRPSTPVPAACGEVGSPIPANAGADLQCRIRQPRALLAVT